MGLHYPVAAAAILTLLFLSPFCAGVPYHSAALDGRPPTRRRLVGSSPPTCRGKCGRCAPCRPVHVPIHPGTTVPLEYYPEAWRCKCGNKLYMP